MTRSSRPSPYQQKPPTVRTAARTAVGATEFLQSHDKMAALLPAVARLTALQKNCEAALPEMFAVCSVMRYDSGELVVSVPSAALAAKLKQKLLYLQDALVQLGWQINAIRLKVQVAQNAEKSMTSKQQLKLPMKAVAALSELEQALTSEPRNAELRAAVAAMVRRHRGEKG